MLVLTRKLNEQIKIGDNITITVIKLRNNQIRLGIDAPRDVRVLRGELEQTANNDAAAQSDATSPVAVSDANRVRSFLTLHSQAEESSSNPSHQATRNDVIDGLMSAAEMIAASGEGDDERGGEPADQDLPVDRNDDAPGPILQVFSGKIDRDGELHESTPIRGAHSRTNAPLAGFFTAP